MTSEVDPIEAIPDPADLRRLIADAIRRRELLRSLLRVAVRKANWTPKQCMAQSHEFAVCHAGQPDLG